MFKQFVWMMLVALVLTGCGNDTYSKAIEQGKLAFANGELEKAMSSFQLALNEKKTEEAENYITSLRKFLDLKTEAENWKWENVITKGEQLVKNETLDIVKGEIESYIKKAKEALATEEEYKQKINEVKTLLNNNQVTEAKKKIEELQQQRNENESLVVFDTSLENVRNIVAETEQQQEQERKKKEAENEALQNLKATYIKKLSDAELKAKSFEYLFDSGVTAEMKLGSSEILQVWDRLLNEIYGALKVQLSASEMDALREKQRAWITYRDQTAENEAADFEGGTFAGVQHLETQGRLTRERCYELVKLYMN